MDICCLLLYLSLVFKHYGEQFESSVQHAVSGSHLSVSHHRNLGLVPGLSKRYLWWTMTLGHVIRTLSLSVTFHQCSILIFVLVLLYHKDKQAQWNILFYFIRFYIQVFSNSVSCWLYLPLKGMAYKDCDFWIMRNGGESRCGPP